jgi:hypothetical protein
MTIDQLLESVDLDFEPRWVTKDGNGDVYIFEDTPEIYKTREQWVTTVPASGLAGYEGLKLAEFDGKDWTECIYEVPRKTTGKIEKLTGALSTVNGKRKIMFPSDVSQEDIISKLHEVIDAVNELKGAKNE